ncbi:MAG: DNA polymerase III subunit alpha [Clostridia bacterium]|nr:DNA polymerase III subunit alpha [Clostridia bacterium]
MAFSHLHLHTQYSLLDGCCRIGDLLDRATALGQTSVAMTDHGVMYGAIEFYKEAKKRGINPVIGCEVYVAPRSRADKQKGPDSEYSHLVLLCENNEGYENLIKMVSFSFTEGFYSKPRVDKELLKKYHGGIIALSACLAGEIPKALLAGDYDGARERAKWYRSVFGENNFFLELQNHGLPEQARINPYILKLSKELGIKTVATNDVHYINRDDAFMHKVLLCIQTGSKINEKNPIEFKTEEFFLKSEKEMLEAFPDCPEAVENAAAVAERCRVEFEFGKIKLPYFDTGGEDHFEYFSRLCREGFLKRYGENPPEGAKERLNYELSVISKMGYVDYYLIVGDFVNYARTHGIPVGPGRGSGAGSIAAYCIGITGIDPIKYDLLFERFLNPERVSMPDFDIDFCYVNRQKVIDYVIEKYGEDHVAQIVTFGTMAARAAVRDVGRAMDIPYDFCDRLAKLVPHRLDMTIELALSLSSDLRALYDSDERAKSLLDMAMKVEGMPRHASTHAAGVVISDRPVSDYVPLSLNDNAVVTQYTMTALEELGLLKMDFLGLRNLTVIADCEKAIRKRTPDFSAEKIPPNDPETLKMMGKGDTNGVFQFESEGMKSVLTRFGPQTIEDLIAIISLYRPGPMDSIPTYIHNRHHPEDVKYATPLLEPILRVTYGCIVYQEQVMQIFRSLAGYSLGRADIVRRAMAKKKHDVMAKERDAFIYGEKDQNGNITVEGAVRRGVPEAVAKKIFDEMSAFSSYAFNKSHAAAYGYLAYITAYLKCHYPKEYFAALLTSVLDSSDKIALYTGECKSAGIKILPPSVNESDEGFTATPEGVRFGLLAVKNLGRVLIEKLISNRETNGKYESFYDFCARNYGRELNRRAIEGLIKSGALDNLGANRRSMLFSLDKVLAVLDEENRFHSEGQIGLFDDGEEKREVELITAAEMPAEDLLKLEKQATGMYLSGHPMAQYTAAAKRLGCTPVINIISGRVRDGSRVRVAGILDSIGVRQLKNGGMLASARIEDVTGAADVTVFAAAYEAYRQHLTEDSAVLLSGRISEREDRDTEIICESISPIEEDLEKAPEQMLKIRVSSMRGADFLAAKRILERFHGSTPVTVFCRDTGKRFSAPERLFVQNSEKLISELKGLLGEKNVKSE